MTVGIYLPQNFATVCVVNTVDSHGGARGLYEVDDFLIANVEIFPSYGEVLATLVDGGGGA